MVYGVGASVVNALSTKLEVTVSRDGQLYYQSFERGKVMEDMSIIGEAEGRGTKVHFILMMKFSLKQLTLTLIH